MGPKHLADWWLGPLLSVASLGAAGDDIRLVQAVKTDVNDNAAEGTRASSGPRSSPAQPQ